MGVPPSATAGRGDHEVHKGHVVALEKKRDYWLAVSASVEHHLANIYNKKNLETFKGFCKKKP
jgi:hypothetical protein